MHEHTEGTGRRTPARQRGGMLSLLLVLLVIGLLAYFALRSYGGSAPAAPEAAGGAPAQVQCTQRISALVGATGGTGPAYAAGYAALPPECQKFAPPPAAGEARPDPDH